MAPERSMPLHNFSLPYLKWGSQRFLRCMKVPPNVESLPLKRRSPILESKLYTGTHQSRSVDARSSRKPASSYSPSSPLDDQEEKQIESIHEKLSLNLRMDAEKMRVPVFNGIAEEEPDAAATKPWNLRTRRSACLAPMGEEKMKGESLRGKKDGRTEFSVSLSREEVEEDFAVMLGKKPPRRPKKRPRIVQKYLDSIFPALSSREITEDSYKVAELLDSGAGKAA